MNDNPTKIHSVLILCGGIPTDRRIVDHVFSSCLNCLRCYRRDTGLNVYELLK